MNTKLFITINNLAGRWTWLDQIGIFFAEYFIYLLITFIVLLWLRKDLRKYVYLALLSSVLSRVVIVEIIKRVINNPRPFEVVSRVHQLIVDEEHGRSFPSGHTVIFFSIAFAFYGTKFFWPLVILASIASISRVFVGVHFPFDILASVVIAAACVLGLKQTKLKLLS